jgi:hypothetical protein
LAGPSIASSGAGVTLAGAGAGAGFFGSQPTINPMLNSRAKQASFFIAATFQKNLDEPPQDPPALSLEVSP